VENSQRPENKKGKKEKGEMVRQAGWRRVAKYYKY
jgi:hypothetical protein